MSEHQTLSSWWGTDLYQIYPRSFNEIRSNPTDYRGEGSLKGITEKLDYIHTIANAIWISPFYPSPMKDSGYDITNYTDVDPRYGTLEDFDELTAEAHKRDIKLMIDLVPNHTSDQHPWFQASSNPKHPDYDIYRDYYIWRDPSLDGGPPNNWGSVFSISQRKKWENGELELSHNIGDEPFIPPLSAWEYCEARHQYYLHDFAVEQPNLNWHSPELIETMQNVLRFWIDRNVDGFRVDVVDHIGKDPKFIDDTFTADMRFNNPYDQLSHDHSIRYWSSLEPSIQKLTEVFDEYEDKDLRLILEVHANKEFLHEIDRIDPQHAASFYFIRMKEQWDARTHKQHLDDYYMNLPQNMVPNQVNGNHDFTRVASRLGEKAARAAATINAMLPGINTIYNGEEGGFTDVDIPDERRDDQLGYRDMSRTPMLWNGSHNAGFSEVEPEHLWLPIDPEYKTKNLELQSTDIGSSLSLYKALHKIKSESDILKYGQYTPLFASNPNVLAFARRFNSRQIIVISNFSSELVSLSLRSTQQILGQVIVSSLNIAHHPYIMFDSSLSLGEDESIAVCATA